MLSGPAVARDYLALTAKSLPVDAIVTQAVAGELATERVLDQLSTNLAIGLSTVINLLDPALIVLGAGLSNIDHLYAETPEGWGQYVFNASAKPAAITARLIRNRWGDDSGVRGAAWLT